MIPTWIIDEISRRQDEERRREEERQRERLELPISSPPSLFPPGEEEGSDRGTVVIELWPED